MGAVQASGGKKMNTPLHTNKANEYPQNTSDPITFGHTGNGQVQSNSKSFLFASSHRETSRFSHIFLDDLVRMSNQPRIGAKETAPVFAPHNGQAKTKEAAEQAAFSALILDFDEGNRSADALKMILVEAGGFLAFTSSSHQQPKKGQPPKNRWKVIVPFSRLVDPEKYLPLAAGAALKFGTDPAQARLSQICYVPNKISVDAPYEVINKLDRPFIDPVNSDFAKACIAAFEEADRPAKVMAAPIKHSTSGFRQSDSVIQMANAAYSVRDILTEAGYKQLGKKYLAPGSTSGTPGVTIMTGDDGKERVVSYHSQSDPLADGHSHDAFDLLLILQFGGDMAEAIKTLSAELNLDGQKQGKREFMKAQAEQKGDVAAFELMRSKATTARLKDETQPFDFSRFSINARIDEMRERMLEDVFIMGNVALRGQLTAIYAKPNTGKTLITLRLLIDAVKNGSIHGENIFYINADDTYKGLIQKTEIAKQHDINMIAPNENGFDAKQFTDYLRLMIHQDTASGKVIVLDTLKKFADLMDKKSGSGFMAVARGFVQSGGSIVLLAHTNKNRNAEGKVIAGGTSDVIDDADCAYTLDEIESTTTEKTVLFENIKARGDVAKSAAYRYSTERGQSYAQLIGSVITLDDESAAQAAIDRDRLEARAKDEPAIQAISEAIRLGFSNRTALLNEARNHCGLSRIRLSKVLDDYTGAALDLGKLWSMKRGADNRHTYELHYGQILEKTG